MGSPACGSFQFYDGGGFFASLHESDNAAGLYAASLAMILQDPDRLLQMGRDTCFAAGGDHVGLCLYALNRCLYVALLELHAELRTRRLADHDFGLATRSSSNSTAHRNSDAW